MKQNKEKAQRRQPKIKWKVFKYLLIFTAAILLLLWLCQVVFLENIYKLIKISEIKGCADQLLEVSDDIGDLAEKTHDICVSGENCAIALKMLNNSTALQLASVDTLDGCVIHNTDQQSKFTLYDAAKRAGGDNLQRFYYDTQMRTYYSIEGSLYDPHPEGNSGGASESIIYTVVTQNSKGEEIVILLNSVISPVSATVKTLNQLLIIISAVLVVLALIIAAVISRKLSKPLGSLSSAAKVLATGDYYVRFDGRGSRETEELAQSLNYAASELSKVDALRRELIANISHDLRTPLTMIEGYGEVMRDLPGENTPENVQVIIDEANRLTSLVNDVLDISRLQSGEQRLDCEPFNLTETVRQTIERYNKLKERSGYIIDFSYDREVMINSDETRIMQVIYNLINNAITYTGEDKTVKVRQIVYNYGFVRIEVEDSGDGIPKDKIEYIWDRYYKVDKVHKRAAVGTGLGLSIVKSIMDMCGGRYGVVSVEGNGSTFWIELPINNEDKK